MTPYLLTCASERLGDQMVLTVTLPHTPLRCNPLSSVNVNLVILCYHHSSCISVSHNQNRYNTPLLSLSLGNSHNLYLGYIVVRHSCHISQFSNDATSINAGYTLWGGTFCSGTRPTNHLNLDNLKCITIVLLYVTLSFHAQIFISYLATFTYMHLHPQPFLTHAIKTLALSTIVRSSRDW